MELRYNFNEIWQIAKKIGAPKIDLIIESSNRSIKPIGTLLPTTGVVVTLPELGNIGGLLSYKDHQVILYIPDQGSAFTDVAGGNKERGKKFHIAHCSTLEGMKKNGRLERYVATTKLTGKFKINGTNLYGDSVEADDVGLYVCQVCLKALNYKQARTKNIAWRLRENFDLSEFFETYRTIFPIQPKRTDSNIGRSGYSDNWHEISNHTRTEARWTCAECGVDLSGHHALLHVHHKNGVKDDNSPQNLISLCAACHKRQPMHDHLNTSYQDIRTINRLRRKAGLIHESWSSVLRMADPAFHGLLDLANSQGWPAPELEYQIPSTGDYLDIAWTGKKFGISLTPLSNSPIGWKVLDLATALSELS